jgi:hypothetical protein
MDPAEFVAAQSREFGCRPLLRELQIERTPTPQKPNCPQHRLQRLKRRRRLLSAIYDDEWMPGVTR